MAIQRPSLFNDADILTFRQTPASDYRIPYTFVEALNEGTLFDRSARVSRKPPARNASTTSSSAKISGSSAPGCCRTLSS